MNFDDCAIIGKDTGTGTETGAEIVSIFAPADQASALRLRHIALVGTYTPRKCGIATFTSDVKEQLGAYHGEIAVDIYALDNSGSGLSYSGVAGVIAADRAADYEAAARAINASGADAVWLQHEYGIFGGPDGEMVVDFVDRLAAPLVLTLHTVLTDPSSNQRRILEYLLTRASRVMLMSEHSRRQLVEIYGARGEVVEVIAHGAPDRPFGRSGEFKRTLGLDGRNVLMTFGLLGPGKGLEKAIAALPAIVERHPGTVYCIVGASHPNLVAQQGEAYREGLQALADDLGVAGHIRWDNRFLDTAELLDQLEACDIYLTPYPNLQQSTSGTLSYAVALGKAVVATPYVHARELLAGGVGELIEPGSSAAIADAVIALLDDRTALQAMQRRAYAKGRTTIWPRFADATTGMLARAIAPEIAVAPMAAVPGSEAVFAMSDATGMLQHAIGIVADRRHGYCLDDNVRALIWSNVAVLDPVERRRWRGIYAAFVQHAWNEDEGAFRNFMRFDRSWCEDVGSPDSNGRTLWSLGHTVERASDPDIRRWAQRLFDHTAPRLGQLDSPRAIAFSILGAAAVARCIPGHAGATALVERGGDVLFRLLESARRPDWAWFEAVLGYDNPRLPQALIEAGQLLDRRDWLDAGLDSLGWIARQQRSAKGHFRPIGSESFGKAGESLPFDQQPLEAQAAIEAALSAHLATGDPQWAKYGLIAYNWYLGANDRAVVIADLATGRCRDGVTPRGANENCGAESILAFQLAHYSMLALGGTRGRDSTGDKFEPGPRKLEKPAAHP